MEPKLVLPLESHQPAGEPWPSILRTLAALTLFFCVVNIANNSYEIYSLLRARLAPRGGTLSLQWRNAVTARVLLASTRIIICMVMAGAAIYLRTRGRAWNVVIICARLWLAMWVIAVAVNMYLFGRGIISMADQLLHGLMTATVPLLVLLLLRQWCASAGLSR